ncbi:hypothetical protein ACHAXA_006287 [Cyclostephanos tholiformis]|uniref:Uncharacterized protein n=1 Tax=Cyclostephanos tholiformis TaxID=382380 RepID=A0ABD3SNW6_9STRA
MRLLLHAAALSAMAAESSPLPREEGHSNMDSTRKRRNSGRRLRGELDTFNDDQVQLELMDFDDDQMQLDMFNEQTISTSSNSDIDAVTWADDPVSKTPTLSPTVTTIPSFSPTTTPISSLSPTASSIPSSRLKLYWETGYEWQGEDNDPYYCMGTSFSQIYIIAMIINI